jgi:hypothetical protein
MHKHIYTKAEEKRRRTNGGGDVSLINLSLLELFEEVSSNPYGA